MVCQILAQLYCNLLILWKTNAKARSSLIILIRKSYLSFYKLIQLNDDDMYVQLKITSETPTNTQKSSNVKSHHTQKFTCSIFRVFILLWQTTWIGTKGHQVLKNTMRSCVETSFTSCLVNSKQSAISFMLYVHFKNCETKKLNWLYYTCIYKLLFLNTRTHSNPGTWGPAFWSFPRFPRLVIWRKNVILMKK